MGCNEVIVVVLIDERENVGRESDRLWTGEDRQGVSSMDYTAISSQRCFMKY